MHETNPQNASKKGVSRKLRLGTVATVTTVIVIAVVMLLNVGMDVLENRFPVSVDLTADGTFTVSDNSLQLAHGIRDNAAIERCEIVVFVDEALFLNDDYSAYPMVYQMREMYVQYYGTALGTEYFNDLLDSFETVLDQFYYMLKQYQVESGGKVTHRFVNMDANPALAAAYQDYGVEPGSVLFLNADGSRSQSFTLMEMISADMNTSNMTVDFSSEAERLVAAKINLVTAVNAKKATVLTGHGEDSNVLASLEAMLIDNACDVAAVDITASETPDEDTSIFIIPAATVDYSEEEIARLREWLDNGGKRGRDLLVIADPLTRLPNLYELIGDEYGIEVLDQLVCETSDSNRYNSMALNAYGTVAESEYTASLVGQRVLMPMTRALKLTVTDDTATSKYAKPLVEFDTSAKVQPLADMLASETADIEEADMIAPDSYPVLGAAYTTAKQYDNDTDRYYTTNVMVFGSSLYFSGSVMSIPSASVNETLFLDTFRGLTGLDSVISVSSRSLQEDTLDFGDSATQNTYAVIFMGVLPLGFVIAGVVVFVRRRRL